MCTLYSCETADGDFIFQSMFAFNGQLETTPLLYKGLGWIATQLPCRWCWGNAIAVPYSRLRQLKFVLVLFQKLTLISCCLILCSISACLSRCECVILKVDFLQLKLQLLFLQSTIFVTKIQHAITLMPNDLLLPYTCK